jgi:hypothetical protein
MTEMDINSELETLLKDLDLFDEHDCLIRLNIGQVRHICRYFYNLGKLETRQ